MTLNFDTVSEDDIETTIGKRKIALQAMTRIELLLVKEMIIFSSQTFTGEDIVYASVHEHICVKDP